MTNAVRKKPAKFNTTPYDTAEQLRTPEEVAAYLNAWFAEAPDNDSAIAQEFGDMAQTKGMSQVVMCAGLGRKSLHRTLGADGNPGFATILMVA